MRSSSCIVVVANAGTYAARRRCRVGWVAGLGLCKSPYSRRLTWPDCACRHTDLGCQVAAPVNSRGPGSSLAATTAAESRSRTLASNPYRERLQFQGL
jgi:hypothetical protein